jgi:hypothetical protein
VEGACETGVEAFDVPPDEVPPDEVPPDEVPPDEVPPDEVPPDEVPDGEEVGVVVAVDAPVVDPDVGVPDGAGPLPPPPPPPPQAMAKSATLVPRTHVSERGRSDSNEARTVRVRFMGSPR